MLMVSRFTCFTLIGLFFAAAVWATAPRSSVPFLEVLQTAESIAVTNPDWAVYRTRGDSMDPFYGNHSLIVVQKTRLKNLRKGMLVLYRTPSGQCIAHQVVAHHGGWIETKGADNERKDPYFIKADMIVGAVFMVLHSAGAYAPHESAAARSVPVAHCRRF